MLRRVEQNNDVGTATPGEAQDAAGARRAVISALYYQYAPPLLAYLRQHTASIEDAEDLLLEIFAAALTQERLLILPPPAQRMWLWRVARNKLVDGYRLRERGGIAFFDETLIDEEPTPEYLVLRQEEYARLHLEVQQLSPLQQEALSLRFVHDLRCAEIGQALGKSEKAIRSMLSRTLNRLRSIYISRQEG